MDSRHRILMQDIGYGGGVMEREGELEYLTLYAVYYMYRRAPKRQVVRILDIHSGEEGCFEKCRMSNCRGMVGDYECRDYTHYILIQAVESGWNRRGHEITDVWVYHVTDGVVEWVFERQEFPSPWMNEFLKSN